MTRGEIIESLFIEGEKYLGAPYGVGVQIGQVNENGQRVFNCSSFTKTLFKDIYDIHLSSISYNQATKGVTIDRSNIERGDLLFFRNDIKGLPIGHVGIYAGNDTILHTYGDGGVKYTKFSGTQWDTRYTTARRLY